MKTYYFNYSIEGSKSFLPMFICVESSNQIVAWIKSKIYLSHTNVGKKIKVWFTNYPNAPDNNFPCEKVPLNWRT